MIPSAGQADEAARRTLRILDDLFDADTRRRVGVRLWDFTCWPDDAPRPATLVLKHPGALRAMLLPGTELALAEAYLYDDFDIVGDIEAVFGLADVLARRPLAGARSWLLPVICCGCQPAPITGTASVARLGWPVSATR